MSAFAQLVLAPRLHAAKAGALRRRIATGWQTDAACVDTDDPDAGSRPALRRRTRSPNHSPSVPDARCAGRALPPALWAGSTGCGAVPPNPQRDAALAELNARALVDQVLDRLLAAPAPTTRRGAA